jgi:hypothetical protein
MDLLCSGAVKAPIVGLVVLLDCPAYPFLAIIGGRIKVQYLMAYFRVRFSDAARRDGCSQQNLFR